MIYLGFELNWSFKHISQKDYIEKYWKVSKNKTLEVRLGRGVNALIGFTFRWDTHCDHAGVLLDLSLFRHFFIIQFYDNRHWNDEKGRYVNYDNPEEVEEYL
jgi:hypothetical protein